MRTASTMLRPDGEDNGVGRRVGDPGERVAVLTAHRLGSDEAVAELGGERVIEPFYRRRRATPLAPA